MLYYQKFSYFIFSNYSLVFIKNLTIFLCYILNIKQKFFKSFIFILIIRLTNKII